MRNPHGYLTITDPEAPLYERDTFTCNHCNNVKVVEPTKRKDPLAGLFCRQCMQYICADCAELGRCEPFEKKLEAMERRDRFRGLIG